MYVDSDGPESGEEAQFERRIDATVYDIYCLSATERNLVDRSVEESIQSIKGCCANRGQ
jgi:hypothetical protein